MTKETEQLLDELLKDKDVSQLVDDLKEFAKQNSGMIKNVHTAQDIFYQFLDGIVSTMPQSALMVLLVDILCHAGILLEALKKCSPIYSDLISTAIVNHPLVRGDAASIKTIAALYEKLKKE